MRDSVKAFVGIIAAALSFPEPIYEFGSFQVEGQEDYADLRPFFRNKKYVGCDVRHGKGVDLILDLHNINVPDESVGTVLIIDTLEHVEFCQRAISEVLRILKPGGIVVATSVMNFPIHDYPHDYWRFTPDGFRSLLKEFGYSIVEFLGESNFPHTVVGIGIKDKNISNDTKRIIGNKVEEWKYLLNSKCSGRSIREFVPPILMELYRKLRYL